MRVLQTKVDDTVEGDIGSISRTSGKRAENGESSESLLHFEKFSK